MNPARKRTLIRLGIVLIAGLAVLVWTITHRSRSVTIENHSGQKVDRLDITLSGETNTFRNIANGGQATGTFKTGGDDLFTVEGRLADDTRIRFSGKAGEDLHFFILPGGAMVPKPRKNSSP
jgi:hypothetical protein